MHHFQLRAASWHEGWVCVFSSLKWTSCEWRQCEMAESALWWVIACLWCCLCWLVLLVPIVLILITSPLCTPILLILISESTMEVEIRKEVDSPTTQWWLTPQTPGGRAGRGHERNAGFSTVPGFPTLFHFSTQFLSPFPRANGRGGGSRILLNSFSVSSLKLEYLLQLAILLWQNQTSTDGGRKVRSVYLAADNLWEIKKKRAFDPRIVWPQFTVGLRSPFHGQWLVSELLLRSNLS